MTEVQLLQTTMKRRLCHRVGRGSEALAGNCKYTIIKVVGKYFKTRRELGKGITLIKNSITDFADSQF